MADSDANFQINITTAANTADAQQVAQSLEAIKDKADAAAPSVKKLANSEEEVGGAAEKAKSPVEGLIDAIGQLVQKFSGGKSSVKEFFEAIETGTGIAIGEKLIEGLGEIGHKLIEVAESGVEFDREMGSLSRSLAASLRQADPAKYLNWDEAKQAGSAALDTLKAKANALGLDIKALGESLSVNLLALTEGGIKEVNQQIEITSLLMQAAAAKGVTGMQAMRDIMDMMQGRAERVILSKELGISNEDIANAKEAGTLFEYLADKLGAYREAADDAAHSLGGLEQTQTNLFNELAGEAAQPIVDLFKEIVSKTNDWLTLNPQIAEEFRLIASSVTNAAATLEPVVRSVAGIVESLAFAASWWLRIIGLTTDADQAAQSHAKTVEATKAAIEGAAAEQKKQTIETEKAREEAEKLAEKLKDGAYARLDPDGKVRLLQFEIDGVRERLTALGLAAQTPQQAFDQLSKFPPEMQEKMIPLIGQWNDLGEKMAGAFRKAESAAEKLWEKINEDAFSKLTDPQKLESLAAGLDGIGKKLHALGVDAESPQEAFKQMLAFPPDIQAKMEPLIEQWLKLKDLQQKTAKDSNLKANQAETEGTKTDIEHLENHIAAGRLDPQTLEYDRQKIVELKKKLVDLSEARKVLEGKDGDHASIQAFEDKRKIGIEANRGGHGLIGPGQVPTGATSNGSAGFNAAFGPGANNNQIDTRSQDSKTRDANKHDDQARWAEARANDILNVHAGDAPDATTQKLVGVIEKLISHIEELKQGNKGDKNGRSIEQAVDELHRKVGELIDRTKTLESQARNGR